MITIAFEAGAHITMHCRMGRDRSNLNGRAIRRIRLVRAADDRRVGGAAFLRQGGGLGRAGHLHLRVCLPAFQRRRDACRGTNGAAARRVEEGGDAAMGGLYTCSKSSDQCAVNLDSLPWTATSAGLTGLLR
jgi:hypothetical protein